MIGLVIAYLLKAHAPLLVLVDTNNIYPYVTNPDTAFPAITYSIDSIDAEYDKDEWVRDDCTFSVTAWGHDYATLQSIALAVRAALELKSGTQGTIVYEKIYVSGFQEEAFMDGFSNTIIFNVKIKVY